MCLNNALWCCCTPSTCANRRRLAAFDRSNRSGPLAAPFSAVSSGKGTPSRLRPGGGEGPLLRLPSPHHANRYDSVWGSLPTHRGSPFFPYLHRNRTTSWHPSPPRPRPAAESLPLLDGQLLDVSCMLPPMSDASRNGLPSVVATKAVCSSPFSHSGRGRRSNPPPRAKLAWSWVLRPPLGFLRPPRSPRRPL